MVGPPQLCGCVEHTCVWVGVGGWVVEWLNEPMPLQGAFQAVAVVPVLSLGASPAQPTCHYTIHPKVWEALMFEAICVRPRCTSYSMSPHVLDVSPVLQHGVGHSEDTPGWLRVKHM